MCESLETLKLDVNLDLHHPFWNRLDCLRICSSSLRKLTLTVLSGLVEAWNIGSVVIHTPNLEDLRYFDETGPYQYSINNLDRFGKVSIRIDDALNVLSFIRPLSNVKHLCLKGCLNEGQREALLLLRKRTVNAKGLIDYDERKIVTTLECCKSHLKRIEIHNYFGDKREIDLIRFLLRNALVLEELVVLPCRCPSYYESPDQKSMESTLKSLPKTSINCSIQVLG
ncbi:hypothetical protein RDABS01_023341 [Bienertia sinuspersici]